MIPSTSHPFHSRILSNLGHLSCSILGFLTLVRFGMTCVACLVQAWAVDLNEYACISMKHNHPETTVSANHVFVYLCLLNLGLAFYVPAEHQSALLRTVH